MPVGWVATTPIEFTTNLLSRQELVAWEGQAMLPAPSYADAEVQKLLAGDRATDDHFGYSVAIDGDVAVVGAFGDDNVRGAAYIFEFLAGAWHEVAKLTASDRVAYDDFGRSVSISGDTVVIGADADGDNGVYSGSAYVFVRPDGGWVSKTEDAKLTPSDGAPHELFGSAVSVSGDTVVIGTYRDDEWRGSAYVFVRPDGGWVSKTEDAKLIASDRAVGDEFGRSVSISGDTIVIGAPEDDDRGTSSGSAYVYVRPVGGWANATETGKLTSGDGLVAYDDFGSAVSIHGDTIVVGAPGDRNHKGSAYVYERPSTGWTTLGEFDAKLIAIDGADSDVFGSAVAIHGDTIVIGARRDDDNGSDSGSAYVYVRPESGWASTGGFDAKLTAPDGTASDQFGISVSISGSTVLIGANYGGDNETNSGSAYVFSPFVDPRMEVVVGDPLMFGNTRAMIDIAGRFVDNGYWWGAVSTGDQFLNEQWHRWSTTVTWVDAMVGDFTGNGFDDIVGRVQETGDWWVAVNDGTGNFTSQRWGRWSTNVDWLDVVVGDFDGDQRADIAGRVAGTGDWWVARSTGSGFVNERWGRWSAGAETWTDVRVGRFDADQADDIVARHVATGAWWVALGSASESAFTNERWGRWTTAVAWLDVLVGDFNGDGQDDVVGRVASNGDWWLARSTGSGFVNERWGRWSAGAETWTDVRVGRFDGDQADDLVGRYVATGDWWVALGSQSESAFTNQRWGRWSTSVTWLDVQVGDFNGDGRADVVGRVASNGDWWVALANETEDGLTNQRWGRWSAGEDTWTDVLVGNFAPTPVPEAPEGAFAASEDPSKFAALNWWGSTLPSSYQSLELDKSAMTDSLLAARRDPTAARLDLLDGVIHELAYLPLTPDDDSGPVPLKAASEIRRLLGLQEPEDWKTLLDDQPFDLLRLDAYFASIG